MSRYDEGFATGACSVLVGILFAADHYIFSLSILAVIFYLNYRWTKNS